MINTRIIGALLTLPSFLCVGTSAFAQNSAPISAPDTSVNEAPSVNFSAGECALFVWAGHPSRLMYISQANARVAYSAQDGIKRYSVIPQSPADKFGQYFSQNLRNGETKPLQLQLSEPAEFYKSVAYSSGTLTLPGSDGWLSVETAQAVSTCNNTANERRIGSDKSASGFMVPAWLETPARLALLHPPPALDTRDIVQDIAPQILAESVITSEPQGSAGSKDLEAPSLIQTTQVDYRREVDRRLEVVEPIERNPMPSPVSGPVLGPVSDPVSDPAPGTILAASTPALPAPVLATPPGYMVQIGAFPNEAVAHQRWADFQQSFRYLKRRQSSVQVAAVEEIGIVYRLRITGLPSKKRALKFCSRLRSDGIDCFVPVGK